MSAKLFRLRIYAADDATVDLTVTSSQLADVPTIPGPIARPLEGKTEAQAWSVTMLSSAVEGDIADASGRPDLAGRLCDWSVSADDGSSYTVVWTGRVTGYNSPDPATFRFTMEDERWVERRTDIWHTNGGTVQIFPPGPKDTFGETRAAGTQAMDVIGIDGTDVIRLAFRDREIPCSRAALDQVVGDVIAWPRPERSDGGNFEHLRLNVGGTDREVITFNRERRDGGGIAYTVGTLEDSVWMPEGIWVYWPAHGYSAPVQGAEYVQVPNCKLHAPTAPPTPAIPRLVTKAPFTLVQEIYNGDYSETDESGNPVTVRYDSATLTALQSDNRYPSGQWIIEGPARMGAWLEENIYLPLQVLPFTEADGEVAPKSVALARDLDPNTLTSLSVSNVMQPYPTWDLSGREAVNSVRFEAPVFSRVPVTFQMGQDSAGDYPSSLIRPRYRATTVDHDNISSLRRRQRTIRLAGWPGADLNTGLASQLAREFFDRVGDGAVVIPEIHVPGAVTDEPGDFVVLDSDTLKLPNLNTNARTGDTIWQILRRDRMPSGGFRLEMEYAGAKQQSLTAPTVALAQNATTPKHTVDVTISALPTGASFLLYVDRGDGDGYQPIPVPAGSGNGTYQVARCPSGTLVSAYAVTTQARRIRSAASTVVTVTTASITAPSTLTVSVTGTTATGSWTVGDSAYETEVLLNGDSVVEMDPETAKHTLHGLTASTAYNTPGFTVRHLDEFGGVSTSTSASFTTSTKTTAPDMVALTGNPIIRRRFGIIRTAGVRLYLYPGDRAYRIRIQRAPDALGSAGTWVDVTTVDGTVDTFFDRRSIGSGTWWYRARHERDGYTPGAWATAVSVSMDDADGGDREDPEPHLSLAVGDADSISDGSVKRITTLGEATGANYAADTLDAAGQISSTTKQTDGVALRSISKGHLAGTGAKDKDTDATLGAISFPTNFQNPPVTIVSGGLTHQPKLAEWSGSYDSAEPTGQEVYAENVTVSGFDIRAKLVQRGVVATSSHTFTGASLTAVSDSDSLNLDDAPANDDSYKVKYSVSLTAPSGAIAEVVVAVDTNDGTGWVERGTKNYAADDAGASWPTESISVVVSGLGNTDDIRIRIKSISVTPSSAGSATVTVDQDTVTYNTSSDSVASATPSGYTVRWEAWGVS